MTKTPSLSDILQSLYEYGYFEGMNHDDHNHPHSDRLSTVEAEVAIHQYIREEVLKIVGEDEPQPLGEGWDVAYVNGKNNLRCELRQKVMEKYGGQNE